MKVKAKFFAAIKDIVGISEAELELTPGTTARDLFQRYCQQHLPLSRFADTTMISVNLEFVPPETRLQEGDEIAFIPPVSGGSIQCPPPESSPTRGEEIGKAGQSLVPVLSWRLCPSQGESKEGVRGNRHV